MDVREFHKKIKQHCDKLSGNCSQCCFLDYCYSSKMDIHDDFLSDILNVLLNFEDNDTDKDVPIIRNRYNVLNVPVNNLHK